MATSGVAANQHVVKAGWMQRESDVLRRWKSCYCILKTNGMLSYYNDEKQKDLQGHVNLPRDCFVLKVAHDVTGVTPPASHDVRALIEIRSSQANTIFCADSADDAQMWKLVFDDVIRANRVAPNAPQGQQPPAIINGTVPPPCYAAGPAPIPPQVIPVNPPPVYTVNPAPVYTVNPSPVTVINPGSTSRVTSTTYYPNGQSVTHIQRGGGLGTCYPVQQTVYSYPGQTIVPNGSGSVTTYQVPNQTTTRVYQTRYY